MHHCQSAVGRGGGHERVWLPTGPVCRPREDPYEELRAQGCDQAGSLTGRPEETPGRVANRWYNRGGVQQGTPVLFLGLKEGSP